LSCDFCSGRASSAGCFAHNALLGLHEYLASR
jgi:hypothetical protein